MMKMKMLGLVGLMTLALAGCQTSSDREAALEDQVAQLEQQVTSLEKEKDELVSDDGTENPSPQKEDSSTSDDDINTLTKAVEDVVKKANEASASGSDDENQNMYFEISGELQDVENRLERYEDHIEDEYRQGNLSPEDARAAEIDLERLEDKLDNAEDRLENIFGYDD